MSMTDIDKDKLHDVTPQERWDDDDIHIADPANLEETFFRGVWTITRHGDPLPLWTRFWAKIFFGYTWKRI